MLRHLTLYVAIVLVVVNLVFLVWKPQEKLFWNRTESSPLGLYWLNDDPYVLGDWVIVSAKSDLSAWAASRDYIGPDWPIIKRVEALEGDLVCRHDLAIFINQVNVARAKKSDAAGRDLPAWSGCERLSADQVFLLNGHPDSMDSRYFGPIQKADLMGAAHRVGLFGRRESAE